MAYVLLFSSFAMAVAVVVMFIMPDRRRAAVMWALGAGFVTVFAIARLSPTNVPGGLGDEVELLPGIEETLSYPDMPDIAAVERILDGLSDRLDPEVAAEVRQLWSSGTGRFWLVSSSFDWIDASLFYAANMTDAIVEWSNEYAVVTTTAGATAVIVFVENDPGSLVLFALTGSGAPDTAETDAGGGFEFG